jgi:hypothetical protein
MRWGPPTSVGFDAPDQGADQRPKLAVGPNLVEINLTTIAWLLPTMALLGLAMVCFWVLGDCYMPIGKGRRLLVKLG